MFLLRTRFLKKDLKPRQLVDNRMERKAGRPAESETQEERDALAKARNDARKKYKTPTNKKHTCRFCKKEIFQARFGAHLFRHHSEELKKMFAPFAKIKTPTFPYGNTTLKPCFVCHGAWEGDEYMEAHAKKHPECCAENQLKAIYSFLECEPPDDTLTIRHNHPTPEKLKEAIDAKEENQSLYKQMAQLTSRFTINNTKLNNTIQEKEASEAQLEALKADLKALRIEKQRVEARAEYYKRKAYFEAELAKDKLEVITTYLREVDIHKHYAEQITETLNKTLSQEETVELEKLRAIAKLSIDVLPPPVSNDIILPPPVDVLPPSPPSATEPEPIKQLKKILSIREKKALGIYEIKTKPEPTPVNTIIERETIKPHCKICAGTNEFYELKECGQCNKLACLNNELKGCYMVDCSKCQKDICYTCNRKNGATRLKPLCSSCVD